ncbi:site-specific DNA-methyltransferase [Spirulina subsalsa FACHB-351]|uniref:Methyltransferase n=1 Tax=Spirulina subsalsa FACHB-351 TaxID=234711 RepID=A0ABT3L1J9_9CYAN|nr:site-specific DNA-methyltransferase [Spirulina subsalsa]MCW6035375.1 site-specific DNA-methyltransferase [Spirulina subsalsa FACHB-351]
MGRGKTVQITEKLDFSAWNNNHVSLRLGNSIEHYDSWEKPTVIVSDGGYGILGFEGDTSDHLDLPEWYQPHIEAWSKFALPSTTLWFWNSEIGWAVVHPILEKFGWRYVNCNIWNKGKGHIAGNINTEKIRRFPVVTEVCVQYVREVRINNLTLKEWLRKEWLRSGLPLRQANQACGVADAATRKYFNQGHLWYFPPPAMFEKLVFYANENGKPEGKPYFSKDGKTPLTGEDWQKMRSKFNCPHGFTNVWDRSALRDDERIKSAEGKAIHLNQKPLDLMKLIIEASSEEQDVVWEPFGGLFSASLAANILNRKAFACEIDETYFYYGVKRFSQVAHQYSLF